MRFNPFGFTGTGTLTVQATNAVSGTFTSGSTTYQYYKFTGSGVFNILAQDAIIKSASFFLVGGGSGGDTNLTVVQNGYGGAGGQILFSSSLDLPSGNYNVTVGSGGAQNLDGGSSSLSGSKLSIGIPGGFKNGSSGIYVRGADNGNASAGGGAGSAQNGYDATVNTIGGAGGSGSYYVLLGSGSYYAGGGGGGASGIFPLDNCTGGAGGIGGGGNGEGRNGPSSTPGTTNTGGGGGGEAVNSGQGQNGGSGIVIIYYPQIL